MANAAKDSNFVSSWLGVLNTDGQTLVPIKINDSTGGMEINVSDTISFVMTPVAPHDDNRVKAVLAMGSDGQAYPLVCNSSGEVLVDE